MRTEPNLQVLGSVLCKGGPDPYLQVRGPGMSGPDLRVEPGPDLVQTWKTYWFLRSESTFNGGLLLMSHQSQDPSPAHQI